MIFKYVKNFPSFKSSSLLILKTLEHENAKKYTESECMAICLKCQNS